MQQQSEGATPTPRQTRPTPSRRYWGRQRSKEREISPWGSVEDPKRTFDPSQYYQTISSELKETRRQHSRKSPFSEDPSSTWKTRRDSILGPFLKNARKTALSSQQKNEEAPLRMNLVTVDLDQQALSPRQVKEEGKEQPVRVRIFKKILQKNQQAEQEYVQRAAELLQQSDTLETRFGQIEHTTIYHPPKRNHRLSYQRTKHLSPNHGASPHSHRQTAFLPKISTERQKQPSSLPQRSDFLCKGEVAITSRKQPISTSFRSQLVQPGEGVLFLKKLSVQA